MTINEVLDRLETVACVNSTSQILDKLIQEEIETIRKELAQEDADNCLEEDDIHFSSEGFV